MRTRNIISKRNIIPKANIGRRRFDPALFFEAVASGMTISKHRKSEIIFSQGDDANAVFYIKKGKVKVTVVSKQGKEAVIAILGIERIPGRRMLDWPAEAIGNGKCNVRLCHHASGQGRDPTPS